MIERQSEALRVLGIRVKELEDMILLLQGEDARPSFKDTDKGDSGKDKSHSSGGREQEKKKQRKKGEKEPFGDRPNDIM